MKPTPAEAMPLETMARIAKTNTTINSARSPCAMKLFMLPFGVNSQCGHVSCQSRKPMGLFGSTLFGLRIQSTNGGLPNSRTSTAAAMAPAAGMGRFDMGVTILIGTAARHRPSVQV